MGWMDMILLSCKHVLIIFMALEDSIFYSFFKDHLISINQRTVLSLLQKSATNSYITANSPLKLTGFYISPGSLPLKGSREQGLLRASQILCISAAHAHLSESGFDPSGKWPFGLSLRWMSWTVFWSGTGSASQLERREWDSTCTLAFIAIKASILHICTWYQHTTSQYSVSLQPHFRSVVQL